MLIHTIGSSPEAYEINAKQKQGNPIDLKKSTILAGGLESAVSNGEAEATIVDANGKKEVLKTKDKPLKLLVESTKDEKFNALVNKVKNEYRHE